MAGDQSVGHVALDGTGSVTIHRTTSPFGMATLDSSGQVYWLEGAGLVINSNADLSNPHALTMPTVSGLLNLAIDPAADIVLWTGYSPPSIRRARMSDGDFARIHLSGPGQTPDDIAVDPTSHKVYWTDIYGGITRANYDGTNQEPLVPAVRWVQDRRESTSICPSERCTCLIRTQTRSRGETSTAPALKQCWRSARQSILSAWSFMAAGCIGAISAILMGG